MMDNIQKVQSNFYAYCNIFNNILKEICPEIAAFLDLEIMQTEVQNCGIRPQKKNVKWHKDTSIYDVFFSLNVYIHEEAEFNKILSSGYQEKGNYIILDMLMERILDEIVLLIRESMEKFTIPVNYSKDTIDLLNQTVTDFAYYIGIPILRGINYISSMLYESMQCNGRIIFVKETFPQTSTMIEFENHILFHEKNYRIIRKILQVAKQDKYAVYDINQAKIIGMITEKDTFFLRENFWVLEFRGHMSWILHNKNMNVVQYYNGTYRIVDDNDSMKMSSMHLSTFYNGDNTKINNALQLIENLSHQSHGTMAVISSNVENEVERLLKNNRAIKIKPVNLIENNEWIYAITSIDGALMLDEELNCYSIGTLLDGPSTVGDISRGARFNSALSYVKWRKNEMCERVLAIIVSEDRMISTII